MRTLPHILTLSRLVAAPFLAWLVIRHDFRSALLLLAAAALTDWFDGYTARWLKVGGGLGAILDPLADKTMLVVLFLALAWAKVIPFWVFAVVIGRDLVIVSGSLAVRIVVGPRKFLPSKIGKVSTFFQIVFVLLSLIHAAWPWTFLFWLQETALVLMIFFTVTSGIQYVNRGIQMARHKHDPVDASNTQE